MTLMPGLIEGHSHLLLHPYNETEWNDQVLKESPVERAIRGSVAAKKSLLAGVTSMRDLGAEGAGYTDVYLKKTIDDFSECKFFTERENNKHFSKILVYRRIFIIQNTSFLLMQHGINPAGFNIEYVFNTHFLLKSFFFDYEFGQMR